MSSVVPSHSNTNTSSVTHTHTPILQHTTFSTNTSTHTHTPSLAIDKPRCACAVFGIFNASESETDSYAAQMAYFGLHAQQHRGQESAGVATLQTRRLRGRGRTTRATTKTHTPDIAVTDSKMEKKAPASRPKNKVHCHKGFGLVFDVFKDHSNITKKLFGSAAIGHTRYSTSGSCASINNVQPFTVHYKGGNLLLAHNGNLSNFKSLRQKFVDNGTLFLSTSDSEIILHLIASSKEKTQLKKIVQALRQCEGAFSLVILTDTALLAIRDPNGFRPLCLGKLPRRTDSKDTDVLSDSKEAAYCVSSETCAFDLINAEFIREIEPGEVLVIDRAGCKNGGKFQSFHLHQKFGISPCIFELIYFSRPDSQVFGAMVFDARERCGLQLAREWPVPKVKDSDKPVAVIPVPDSSNLAALAYQRECARLGYRCTYELGLIRNHYVGRTFIVPNQDARALAVRCKFNIVKSIVKNRIVVFVDDSIVRGTTSKHLARMAKKAGASEVHFRVASPPIISPCYYGMDFPSPSELLATLFPSTKKMSKKLNLDSLCFLSLKGMMKAMAGCYKTPKTWCSACFTGKYPIPMNKSTAYTNKQDFEW